MEALERTRLAHALRHLRLGKGLRQSDLAIPGQVSRSAISALERAQIENPSKQLLTAVAVALGVRYSDLVVSSDSEALVIDLLHEARALWQHNPKKALHDAQRALVRSRRLHLYDTERETTKLLAEWYGLHGDPFRAAAYAVWALARPDDVDAMQQAAVIVLAEHLRDLGEWRGAITLFRQFLFGIHRQNPQFSNVFLQLGRTYSESQNYRQAVRMFVRAQRDAMSLGKAETTGWALVGLSRALGFTNRHQDATRASDQAKSLAGTYHWPAIESAILRTDEILDLLFSPSMPSARQQWQRTTKLLQENSEPVDDQVNLLQSWIYYASNHEAWTEVLAATNSGLELIRSTTAYVSNRGKKGQFLWSRAQAKHATGQPWQFDHEWASDLLQMNDG